MADSEQIVLLDHVDGANLTENGQIITVQHTNEGDTEEVNEDILKQALAEASQGFDETEVQYTEESVDNVVADEIENGQVVDSVSGFTDSVTGTYSLVESVQTVDSVVADEIENGQVIDSEFTDATDSISGTSYTLVEPVQPGIQTVQTIQTVHGDQLETSEVVGIPEGDSEVSQEIPVDNVLDSSPPTFRVVTSGGSAPLGSSGNPIRIVQQGNQYTSMQQLSADQLAQIMQVVQQQQVAKSTTEGTGQTVLFNPNTQTRIVYRVIYPSELHGKSELGATTSATIMATPRTSQPRQTIQVPKQLLTLSSTSKKRHYRKRTKQEEEERFDGPELTKEEKEERKKMKPKTRSGRVSRPPRYMTKDYKHIHVLDMDEEVYDDSDGGYSDFKVSDSDDEDDIIKSSKKDAPYIHKGQFLFTFFVYVPH